MPADLGVSGHQSGHLSGSRGRPSALDPQVPRQGRIADFPGRSATQTASFHVMGCIVCRVLVPFWSPTVLDVKQSLAWLAFFGPLHEDVRRDAVCNRQIVSKALELPSVKGARAVAFVQEVGLPIPRACGE